MVQPNRKPSNECLVEICAEEAKTAGMCQRHYNRWYYHHHRGHGPKYWKGYDEDTEMRDSCSSAFNSKATDRRRGIKAVK